MDTDSCGAADEPSSRRRLLATIGGLAAAAALPACVEVRDPRTGDDGTGTSGSDGQSGGDSGGTSTADPATAPPGEAVAAIERAIHDRVNVERTGRELEALALDEEIGGVARAHSRDMVEREYVGHETPDGAEPSDRMDDQFPDPCRTIGENVAAVPGEGDGSDTDEVARRVVEGWMDSPGHRENVLRERFDAHGIGVAVGERRVYATQNFCGRGGGFELWGADPRAIAGSRASPVHSAQGAARPNW